MPNLIKKVLANIVQTFTETEKLTAVVFNNGSGQFQRLRLIIDDSEIYDVYIQLSIAGTALFYKCPDILYQG